jgi:hypothetical protein
MRRDPYAHARDACLISLVALLFPHWEQHVTEDELLSGEFVKADGTESVIRRRIRICRQRLEFLTEQELHNLCEAVHALATQHWTQDLRSVALTSFEHAEAPDAEHWSRCEYWTIDEATALLMDLDPRKYTWTLVEPFVRMEPVALRFAKLRDLLLRANKKRKLADEPSPIEVLDWAHRCHLEVPARLKAAVEALHLQRS